jgi:hypothetical protein
MHNNNMLEVLLSTEVSNTLIVLKTVARWQDIIINDRFCGKQQATSNSHQKSTSIIVLRPLSFVTTKNRDQRPNTKQSRSEFSGG